MAAAVSSPWGKPGAWALDAEENEEELQQQQASSQNSSADLSAEFPSLAAAATTKTKKKKGQTLSLAEFSAYGSAKPAPPPQIERLTPDELLSLPTGPRQRSAEELERSRLGGGFRSYGSGSRYGDDSSNQRWGSSSSRVSEDGGRRGGGFNRESDRDSAPSRADEIDNWAAMKKPMVGNGLERRERGGFFESQSKADEVDSWVANKPSEPRRFGSTNGGYGGGRFEKKGSFDSLSRNRDSLYGSASDSDSWGRIKEESGGASGGSRPRLMLQPRTLPVTNEKPHNSPIAEEKPKGANPFGNARPREEVLAEKGKDWKEIDEKLEAVKIKDLAVEKGGTRGFGLGNGRQDDRAERTWRKSPERSEEGGVEEEVKKEAAEETKEDKEEQN